MIVGRGGNARNRKSYVGGPVCYRDCTSDDDDVDDDVARR